MLSQGGRVRVPLVTVWINADIRLAIEMGSLVLGSVGRVGESFGAMWTNIWSFTSVRSEVDF